MQQCALDTVDRKRRIYLVSLLIVRNDPLGANNSSTEVGVNGQGDHLIISTISPPCNFLSDEDLGVHKRNRDPVMVDDPSELLPNVDNLAHHCPDRLEKQGQWQSW